MSEFDVILDSSQQNLKEVPPKILEKCNLKMLYLQHNFIKKLPSDFFLRLPSLSWLDLRNNHLTKIPESIAHHQHLENLLLSDNKIEVLPNELGLVPKLKVLQIANNPIIYPSSKIISAGTKTICSFLKNQYDKELASLSQQLSKESKESVRHEPEEEREIEIMNHEHFGEPIWSSLTVKGLSKEKGDDAIVHNISKDKLSKKIFIKSYFNEDEKYIQPFIQSSDHNVIAKKTLKQDWMDKLRILLQEQEKILQQERNLQALSSWRYKRKSEPIREVQRERPTAPYATYSEYDSMITREEIVNQIDRLIDHNRNQPKQENMEKVIDDLLSQLKEMESTYGGELKSPRSEIESARSEIMKIMAIHKKLMRLRQINYKL